MGMLLALAIPTMLMLLPLRLSLQLTHAARTQGALGVGVGALRLSFPFRVEREWQGEEVVTVCCTFAAEYVKRPSGMFCARRGPLLYALPIRE